MSTTEEDGTTGVRVLEAHEDHFHEGATTTDCPGIHGEGTAADEHVVFGCEDGALMYADGEFTKFRAPDDYGRMGNAYVSEDSPLVVGDYEDDPEYAGYVREHVALIDTEAESYEVVELPDGLGYTWRGIVRGPDARAHVLATDGAIHTLDPATGELGASVPVMEAWEGPEDWQDPHPAMTTDGEIAYVAEPGGSGGGRIHAVDLAAGEVIASVDVDFAPNEMAVALGGE
ncbi:hypothetical protein [Brevibacterium litoralis]|uniref:hypothetical protein n=1 Tax=Brevibacterium litoralis TaxID=3138935 RepID=UPI0032ED6630